MRLDVWAPAGLTATLRLRTADQERSEVEIDGDLVAKVPLLGPRIEKAAVPYVSTVLRAGGALRGDLSGPAGRLRPTAVQPSVVAPSR